MSETPKTYEGRLSLVFSEQFLATCSPELRTFLKERPCTSLQELGVSASRYLEAHNKTVERDEQEGKCVTSADVASDKGHLFILP